MTRKDAPIILSAASYPRVTRHTWQKLTCALCKASPRGCADGLSSSPESTQSSPALSLKSQHGQEQVQKDSSSWTAALLIALAEHIKGEQKKVVEIDTLCSGTGSPTVALQVCSSSLFMVEVQARSTGNPFV